MTIDKLIEEFKSIYSSQFSYRDIDEFFNIKFYEIETKEDLNTLNQFNKIIIDMYNKLYRKR